MTNRIRLQHVTVQPALVSDDGETLTPGPTVEPLHLTLAQLREFVESLPEQVARLNEPIAPPE